MINKLLIILIILGSSIAYGIDDKGYLFDNSNVDGGYSAIGVQGSKILGKNAFMLGGQGGWYCFDKVLLGFGGYFLSNNIKLKDKKNKVDLYYMGLLVEGDLYSYKFLDVKGSILIAPGKIGYNDVLNDKYNFDFLGAIDVLVSVDFNITSKISFNLGYGIRRVQGLNLVGVNSKDFNNSVVSVLFKGKF